MRVTLDIGQILFGFLQYDLFTVNNVYWLRCCCKVLFGDRTGRSTCNLLEFFFFFWFSKYFVFLFMRTFLVHLVHFCSGSNMSLFPFLELLFSSECYIGLRYDCRFAGQIGYALVPMIARGVMLGADQPVILHMLDIPPAAEALNGVKMELVDAAFPLLKGMQ